MVTDQQYWAYQVQQHVDSERQSTANESNDQYLPPSAQKKKQPTLLATQEMTKGIFEYPAVTTQMQPK